MARAPTVYRWDDQGAPDIATILPTSADRYRLLIHTLFRACLVDGYGSKAGAGWSMPHQEINDQGCRFVVENAAKSGALLYEGGVFSGGSTNVATNTIWACVAAPSMDSPVGAWSNEVEYSQRSAGGADRFHRLMGSPPHGNVWIIVANENSALLLLPDSRRNDFDMNSTRAVLGDSGRLYFGAMNDNCGLGGIANPQAGNFFITSGSGSSGYSNLGSDRSDKREWLSAGVDILGLPKSTQHKSLLANASSAPFIAVSCSPNAWLPLPYLYFLSGDSGPAGASGNFRYHHVTAVGIRRLAYVPNSSVYLNQWMQERGWQYGVPFSFVGSTWIIVKSERYIADLICLDAAEWGG